VQVNAALAGKRARNAEFVWCISRPNQRVGARAGTALPCVARAQRGRREAQSSGSEPAGWPVMLNGIVNRPQVAASFAAEPRLRSPAVGRCTIFRTRVGYAASRAHRAVQPGAECDRCAGARSRDNGGPSRSRARFRGSRGTFPVPLGVPLSTARETILWPPPGQRDRRVAERRCHPQGSQGSERGHKVALTLACTDRYCVRGWWCTR